MADTQMPSEDSIVILHGLKGRADLNGTKAVVLKAETPEEEVRVYEYIYDQNSIFCCLLGRSPMVLECPNK